MDCFCVCFFVGGFDTKLQETCPASYLGGKNWICARKKRLTQTPRGAFLWFMTGNRINCLHWLSDLAVFCLKMRWTTAKLERIFCWGTEGNYRIYIYNNIVILFLCRAVFVTLIWEERRQLWKVCTYICKGWKNDFMTAKSEMEILQISHPNESF